MKAGRSSTQTRPVTDKRPGKPRFMSSQRERFCQLIAFQGCTASEAYRIAYESEAAEHTVHVEASKLRNDPEVAQRIENLQRPSVLAGELTLDKHLDTLGRIRDMALHGNQLAVAVQAEVSRGKVKGFYVERKIEASGSLADLLAGSHGEHEKGQPVKALAPRKRGNR